MSHEPRAMRAIKRFNSLDAATLDARGSSHSPSCGNPSFVRQTFFSAPQLTLPGLPACTRQLHTWHGMGWHYGIMPVRSPSSGAAASWPAPRPPGHMIRGWPVTSVTQRALVGVRLVHRASCAVLVSQASLSTRPKAPDLHVALPPLAVRPAVFP